MGRAVSLILILGLLIIGGCSGTNTSRDAQSGETRRESNIIEYYLNPDANEASEEAVKEAFLIWDEATSFTFVYKGRHRAGLKRDGKNTVSFLLTWPEDVPRGKTAYCRNWYNRRGNIVESDIIFNMSLARFTTRKTNTPDSYYIEGVLSHEIGHMLGLGHIDSPDSLMKPFSPPEESYFMGRIDKATLREYHRLYGHK